MTLELNMLALSVVLGLVQIVLASHTASLQRGYRWTASSRDEPAPPLTGVAGRLERALDNFAETFPLFAATVLAAHVAGKHSSDDRVGCSALFLGPGRLCSLLRSRAFSGAFSCVECRNARDHINPPLFNLNYALTIGGPARSGLRMNRLRC